MVRRIDWSEFSGDPRAPGADTVRASDADRNAALSYLTDAYADGRLNPLEHAERTDGVLQSIFLGDLAGFLADLEPQSLLPVEPLVSPGIRELAEAKYAKERRDSLRSFASVSAITLAIWGATSLASATFIFFWPIFPIAAMGVGYVMTLTSRKDRIAKLEAKYAKRELRKQREQARNEKQEPG